MFEELAPDFGFNSLPSHTHVLDEDAPDFGLISLPSNTQVFDDDAPDFGFSSVPVHTQLLGSVILFDIYIPFEFLFKITENLDVIK